MQKLQMQDTGMKSQTEVITRICGLFPDNKFIRCPNKDGSFEKGYKRSKLTQKCSKFLHFRDETVHVMNFT